MAMPSGLRSSEPVPVPSIKGKRAEYRGESRHQDRPEPQKAGLIDRLARRKPFRALGVKREVDHHDRVLLHDADQQDDADDRDDIEFMARSHQGEERADAGGRQSREDRDRMNEALVENTEHDIHRDHRGDDQEKLIGRRRAESRGGALEGGDEAIGKPDRLPGIFDRPYGGAERDARSDIEGDRRSLETVRDG